MKTGKRATPDDIGRLRRELRRTIMRTDGVVPSDMADEIAALDSESRTWLEQRLRPKELELIAQVCGKVPGSDS